MAERIEFSKDSYAHLLEVLRRTDLVLASENIGAPTKENYRRLLLFGAALLDEEVIGKGASPELERITAETRGFLRASRRVCFIERKDAAESTGILIGPNILLTAAHTLLGTARIFANPRQVAVRVDRFWRTPQRQAVRTSTSLVSTDDPEQPQPDVLASSIKVNARGEIEDENDLDYIIVRLADPLGDDILGQNSSRQRGWMGASFVRVEAAPGEKVTVLQHPRGGDQQFAYGAVGRVNGRHIFYDVDADLGSSGACILSEGKRLIGMHTGQNAAGEKIGTSLKAIFEDVRMRFPQALREAFQPFPRTTRTDEFPRIRQADFAPIFLA